MRSMAEPLAVICALFVAGCGARVTHAPEATDAASDGSGGASVDAAADASSGSPADTASGADVGVEASLPPVVGCPDAPPAKGTPCIGPSYLCRYFVSGEACSRAWKCTTFDESSFVFMDYPGCDPRYEPKECDEGLDCGFVEGRRDGCVVSCTRSCHCGGDVRRLECRPVVCSDS
jgi:hypothetical protein